jgi:hypothetical protein
LRVYGGRPSCLMFETARRHMPEDDIVMCFVINNLVFWYSRYTVPVSWGLDVSAHSSVRTVVSFSKALNNSH